MKLNESKIMPCNQHWVSTRFHDMEQCKWKPIVSETLCQFLKALTCINSNTKNCFSCTCIILGEHGWHSGEITCLPPMCPGLDSQTQHHMWVEFFVGSLLCSKRFFLWVLRFSPLLKNQHFQIPIWSQSAQAFLYELLWTHWCSAGKQITFTFFLRCNLLPPLFLMRLYISWTNLCFPSSFKKSGFHV